MFYRQSDRRSPKLSATEHADLHVRVEFNIQPHIEKPDNNVWVMAADHPDINNTIANAVVHGAYVTFLVLLVVL